MRLDEAGPMYWFGVILMIVTFWCWCNKEGIFKRGTPVTDEETDDDSRGMNKTYERDYFE